MDHCAIDVGGKKSQICVRNSGGTIQFEGAWETPALGDHLRQLPRCRVILETAAESFRIADQARAAGHEVRVVPATLVRTLGVGARRTKTDKRDARALSEVSTRIDLPSVHIPSARSREWKTMAGVHDALVSCRTKLINNVRGWLRGQARKPRSGVAETFAERVRRLGELPVYITSAEDDRRALRGDCREREALRFSHQRRPRLQEADDRAWRRAIDGTAIRRRHRCGHALRQCSQGRGLSRALAGGEIELRAPTAPRHHQSRVRLGEVGADPGGLDSENVSVAPLQLGSCSSGRRKWRNGAERGLPPWRWRGNSPGFSLRSGVMVPNSRAADRRATQS